MLGLASILTNTGIAVLLISGTANFFLERPATRKFIPVEFTKSREVRPASGKVDLLIKMKRQLLVCYCYALAGC